MMYRALFKSRRHRRGLTMIELVITAAIFGLIGIFISAILLATARQTAASRQTIPADANNYRVVDRIRAEVLTAQFGSVNISQDGRTISYFNPARGTRGEISFDGETSRLEFRPNVLAQNQEPVIWSREMDGRFSFADAQNKRVVIEVESQGMSSRRENLAIVYTDVVTVRN